MDMSEVERWQEYVAVRDEKIARLEAALRAIVVMTSEGADAGRVEVNDLAAKCLEVFR